MPMFDINKHNHEYFYDYATVIENLIPENLCDILADRVNQCVSKNSVEHVLHESLGTDAVSDLGGKYNHYIFKGQDIRNELKELVAIYHAVVPMISMITCSDIIVSPYPQSDINIKAFTFFLGFFGLPL